RDTPKGKTTPQTCERAFQSGEDRQGRQDRQDRQKAASGNGMTKAAKAAKTATFFHIPLLARSPNKWRPRQMKVATSPTFLARSPTTLDFVTLLTNRGTCVPL